MSALIAAVTDATLALYRDHERLTARVAELEALQSGDRELWCVLIQETGETLAMKSKDAAERQAGELNGLGLEGVTAAVVASPWPLDIHFDKAFKILEAWLEAANHALQSKTAEVVQIRSFFHALANPQDEIQTKR